MPYNNVSCDRGVVDTSSSPYARLRAVPIRAVALRDGFWKPRLDANVEVSIPELLRMLEEHGVLDNFRRLYGAKDVERRGPLFTDSDLYKWMEAAAFVLQSRRVPEIEKMLNDAIDTIIPAQREDGYLNTWFVDDRHDKRYTNFQSDHELYCAGHLIQAAIAHHRATGETRLLECAIRFADHLCNVIPAIEGAFAGHPEIELALVELYREMANIRYLELAKYLLDASNFAKLQKIEGHAVRALYFCSGGADYYSETGDKAFRESLERQWSNFTQAKVYITGGAGGRYVGESFGCDYELPNARAYSESCAAIAAIFWNWRMLGHSGDARFADLMERGLYNGFLSSISLDGGLYFYMNPLSYNGEGEGDPWYPWARRNKYERTAWHSCTCCPPNIQRLLASLPGYFYSTSSDGLWVHLYDNNDLDWHLLDADETRLKLSQTTNYPWEGDVTIDIYPESPNEFSLYLRIPDWATDVEVTVNGEKMNIPLTPGSYAPLRRIWRRGDKVQLSLPMSPVVMMCNPRVDANRGSVALQRGPIVYCLESHDNPGFNVQDAVLTDEASIVAEYREDFLGGVTVLVAQGAVATETDGFLYRPQRSISYGRCDAVLTAIPYYAWNNRGSTAMTVWMQRG